MKSLFLTISFLLISITTITAQGTYTLTINFTGMQSDKGAVYIGLHNQENEFLKKHFKEGIATITNKKATFVFENIPQGEYAISSFHDENANNKMDTNFIGIPKEPIGISNNAKGFMGPPKYKDAKFTITKNISMTIKIE